MTHVDEHESFADSRIGGFVFVPSRENIFDLLDRHVDSSDGYFKPPMVVIGDEGSGKSALLANWAHHRQQFTRKDEFLFKYFVGASSRSLKLQHMLHKLVCALKDSFQLREMTVPSTEERLRWSLSRFLEAAAKKQLCSHIVIVIDAVNRIKSEDAPDGALHWLPTEFPVEVRFIVSSVEFDTNDSNFRRGRLKATDTALLEGTSEQFSDEASDMSSVAAKGFTRLNSTHLDTSRGSPNQLEEENTIHRTYLELKRRKCLVLRMDPLAVSNRHAIIRNFEAKFFPNMKLDDSQQFNIVTSPNSSQPMFLRALLGGLRWCRDQRIDVNESSDAHSNVYSFSNNILGQLLDCHNAAELIACMYTICSNFVSNCANDGNNSVLGKVFAVIYCSRNGLTEDEIWGSVEMATRIKICHEVKQAILRVLDVYTMDVAGRKMFSHDDFRSVVYDKFICTPAAHCKWHELLARYFQSFMSCDRKAECLVYHLEVIGDWSSLKNKLTDIDLLSLWWTPKFKDEFVSLWASLTKRRHTSVNCNEGNAGIAEFRLVTGEFEPKTMKFGQSARPYFDVVEEYVRSLDEHQKRFRPKDEAVADVVLTISEFLLEFSILGHEESSDVPDVLHPIIPSEDFAAIGVPYMSCDPDGRAAFHFPAMFDSAKNLSSSILPSVSGPCADSAAGSSKDGNEEYPARSHYFFHRWLWIQFPLIAVANCGQKFLSGIKDKEQALDRHGQLPQLQRHRDLLEELKLSLSDDYDDERSVQGFKRLDRLDPVVEDNSAKPVVERRSCLPSIPKIRKKTRTRGRVVAVDSNEDLVQQAQKRIEDVRWVIQTYKDEYDVLVQQKAMFLKKIQEMETDLEDLVRIDYTKTVIRQKYDVAMKNCADSGTKVTMAKTLMRNYKTVRLMCDRHPAYCAGLVHEIEREIEQDKRLLEEIRIRLFEEKFENYSHTCNFGKVKGLVQSGLEMQATMLEFRKSVRNGINENSRKDIERIQSEQTHRKKRVALPKSDLKTNQDDAAGTQVEFNGTENDDRENKIGEFSQIVTRRTGIPDLNVFFARMTNVKNLEFQMVEVRKVCERRLADLRNESQKVDQQLDESRYDLSSSVVAEDSHEIQRKIVDGQQKLKRSKEKALSSERLLQNMVSGLYHIGDQLGLSPSKIDNGAEELGEGIAEYMHTIESVLDLLMEEKEKIDSANNISSDATSQKAEAVHHRPPELEIALARIGSSRAKIASKINLKCEDVEKAGSHFYQFGNTMPEETVSVEEEIDRGDASESARNKQRTRGEN